MGLQWLSYKGKLNNNTKHLLSIHHGPGPALNIYYFFRSSQLLCPSWQKNFDYSKLLFWKVTEQSTTILKSICKRVSSTVLVFPNTLFHFSHECPSNIAYYKGNYFFRSLSTLQTHMASSLSSQNPQGKQGKKTGCFNTPLKLSASKFSPCSP